LKLSISSRKAKKLGVSYDRVSTQDQAFEEDGSMKHDGSTKAQQVRCQHHVTYLSQKTGITHKLVEQLSDKAFSGKDTNRPGYQRLWGLISEQKIDFVVAAELSRLSRSVVDFLAFVAHCEANKVDLFIIGLDLDTSTPFGRMMVVVLVALAQFEREMTAVRVRENALARLLRDGKINGASEILGLDRDPELRGHFVANHEELAQVERVLKMFVAIPSKKKVLDEAKRQGIMGKDGRELNLFALEQILENVRWRYRGQWYANRENQDEDTLDLPNTQRYQTVNLPHGQLIDTDLLDEVQRILDDPERQKKRTGKGEYVYLLSHLLFYQDGTKFTGALAKGTYRYYHNSKRKLRIHCDPLNAAVEDALKENLLNHHRFMTLVEDAHKRRSDQLPALNTQIEENERELKVIDNGIATARLRLVDPETTAKAANFWMMEIEAFRDQKDRKTMDLEYLYRLREEIMTKDNLSQFESLSLELLKTYDRQPPRAKRNIIDRLVKRIIVEDNNRISIELVEDSASTPGRSVNHTVKKFEWKEHGSSGRARTADQVINSHLLYQLSY
jgi:DNA invertase Pin-like site-specific DNA recombinase